MRDTPLTLNHRGLGALVHQLRQDLDVQDLARRHWVAIQAQADPRLLAYDPDRALAAAALAAARIYGSRRIGDWHSIPAVLRALPHERETRQRTAAVRRFGLAHGQREEAPSTSAGLSRICADFTREHATGLAQIQAFAERERASPDAIFDPDLLPPVEEFEALYRFARSLHRLLAVAFAAGRPPRPSRTARGRLERLLRAVGLAEPGAQP